MVRLTSSVNFILAVLASPRPGAWRVWEGGLLCAVATAGDCWVWEAEGGLLSAVGTALVGWNSEGVGHGLAPAVWLRLVGSEWKCCECSLGEDDVGWVAGCWTVQDTTCCGCCLLASFSLALCLFSSILLNCSADNPDPEEPACMLHATSWTFDTCLLRMRAQIEI